MSTSVHKQRSKVQRIVTRIIAGAVSALIVVASFAAIVVFQPFTSLVDSTSVTTSAVTTTVSTEQVQYYCPSRMELVDTESYGDSEYQVSTGDIASSARYAAFGSVYRTLVNPLDSESIDDTEELETDDDGSVMVLSSNVDEGASVVETQLFESTTGTGVVSSVASWATDGDLQGLSAASCIVPALEHSFLLTDTQSGVTQQLIVSNPTDSAAAVTITAWGTDSDERIALSTGSTLTVGSYDEVSVDLSTAASDQDGIFVTVTCDETSVAAVVRTVRADGLTPMGSDYALPVSDASRDVMLPSVREGDTTTVVVYGESDTDVTMYWVTEEGMNEATTGEITANQVAVFDLGTAPDGALGVMVSASSAVVATAEITVDGDDQSDFALINAAQTAESSAVVLPDGVDGELTLMNDSSDDATITLSAYDENGVAVEEREITVPAESAVSLDVADLDDDACLLEMDDPDSTVTWGARLTSSTVEDADLVGIAYVGSTALTPVSEQVSAEYNQTIVN